MPPDSCLVEPRWVYVLATRSRRGRSGRLVLAAPDKRCSESVQLRAGGIGGGGMQRSRRLADWASTDHPHTNSTQDPKRAAGGATGIVSSLLHCGDPSR